MQFLAEGIMQHGEAGVFVTFEETPDDIRRNVRSFGWEVAAWEEANQWRFVDASPNFEAEIVEAGSFDLEALIVRIGYAVEAVDARRVSLDSVGAIFGQFTDRRVVRQEILRIVRALKERGVTSIVTTERAAEYGDVARYEVEEFTTDNVVILRNTLANRVRRRTIEILKFRGATHARGEHPFSVMQDEGIVVIPLSAIELRQTAKPARVSSGLEDLDEMLRGGLYGDSVVLASGASGTGKTLLATHFIQEAPAQGHKALLFAFEESEAQIIRNAQEWGIDFEPYLESGLLRIESVYPETADLEDHLIHIQQAIDAFGPDRVVIDSLSALERVATTKSFREFAVALISDLKQRNVLALFTTTTPTFAHATERQVDTHLATISDVILLLRHVELYGELQRGIAVLKMRGSDHDRRIRKLDMDANGLHIGDPIPNVAGVISGNLDYIMDDEAGFTPMRVPQRMRGETGGGSSDGAV